MTQDDLHLLADLRLVVTSARLSRWERTFVASLIRQGDRSGRGYTAKQRETAAPLVAQWKREALRE